MWVVLTLYATVLALFYLYAGKCTVLIYLTESSSHIYFIVVDVVVVGGVLLKSKVPLSVCVRVVPFNKVVRAKSNEN